MKSLLQNLRVPTLALAMFAGGLGAAQLLQPAQAQGSGGGAISAASDNVAWVVVGGQVYHCVHTQYSDKCHSM